MGSAGGLERVCTSTTSAISWIDMSFAALSVLSGWSNIMMHLLMVGLHGQDWKLIFFTDITWMEM